MYWALNADFSGFKAKLRVINIEPGMQEVKNKAKQNNITDKAIVMEVRRKLSAINSVEQRKQILSNTAIVPAISCEL